MQRIVLKEHVMRWTTA